MATLDDEVGAMRSVERALAKADKLGGNARARTLGWARDRTAELLDKAPPQDGPPPDPGTGHARMSDPG